MPRSRRLIPILICLSSACVFVPSVMWQQADENRARLNQVVVGQSTTAVPETVARSTR